MCLRNPLDKSIDASTGTLPQPAMSFFGDLYSKIYNLICGEPPGVRPWHFQWLSVRDLRSDLRHILPKIEGRVLDVGCGLKPYSLWLDPDKTELVGIDTSQQSKADIVVGPNDRWPFANSSFDAVICTQVLEHVSDLDVIVGEIDRVLKASGLLVVTVPFIYNTHGEPEDYRRFSEHGINQLFEKSNEVLEVRPQGGIGSAVGTLWLNWIEISMNSLKVTRFAKGLLMPVWVMLCLATNIGAWLLDKLDRTRSFYGNVLLVARRRSE